MSTSEASPSWEIDYESAPDNVRVEPGMYKAVCTDIGKVTTYIEHQRKFFTVRFTLHETGEIVPKYINVDDRNERLSKGAAFRSDLYRVWVAVMGRRPERGEKLSYDCLLGREAIVELVDKTHKETGEIYSRVKRVLSAQCALSPMLKTQYLNVSNSQSLNLSHTRSLNVSSSQVPLHDCAVDKRLSAEDREEMKSYSSPTDKGRTAQYADGLHNLSGDEDVSKQFENLTEAEIERKVGLAVDYLMRVPLARLNQTQRGARLAISKLRCPVEVAA